MKISVMNAMPVSETEQFAYMKECGFDACDFSLGKYFNRDGLFAIETVTDEEIEKHFTMLRKEAEKAGFEVGQTHSAFSGHPANYDFDMDEIVARQVASIKATHYLGAKYCVVHPIILPGRQYDHMVQEAYEQSVDFYRRLIPALEKYNVTCCIENMWHIDPAYGHICPTILSRAEEMVRMCDELGEHFAICLDVGHAPLTQDDPAEMIRMFGKRLVCLHTHDNDGLSDLHTFPFAARHTPYGLAWNPPSIDWPAVMQALEAVGYEGNLNFEITIPGPEGIHKAGMKYLCEIGKYLISLREGGKEA